MMRAILDRYAHRAPKVQYVRGRWIWLKSLTQSLSARGAGGSQRLLVNLRQTCPYQLEFMALLKRVNGFHFASKCSPLGKHCQEGVPREHFCANLVARRLSVF